MRFLYYLLFPYLANKEEMHDYWASHSFAAAVALTTWLMVIPAVIAFFLGNIWWQLLLAVMYVLGIAYLYVVARKEDRELAQQAEDVDESGPDQGRPG